MKTDNIKVHVVGTISTAVESLRRADSLIKLAQQNPKDAGTLAACVTILLAAALDQAVTTSYDGAAKRLALENDSPIADSEPAKYLSEPLWVKVQSLPSILSGDEVRLRLNHQSSKALQELIYARNRLMHVDEPASHLIGPSQDVELVDGGVRATFRLYLNEWLTMKLATSEKFYAAVDLYFREVLDPAPDRIKEGIILFRINK